MLLLVECPHCQLTIEVVQVNCAIFRCGVYKKDMTQIPPHLEKAQCDALVEKQEIYGCGKPFRLVVNEKTYACEKCDYI